MAWSVGQQRRYSTDKMWLGACSEQRMRTRQIASAIGIEPKAVYNDIQIIRRDKGNMGKG